MDAILDAPVARIVEAQRLIFLSTSDTLERAVELLSSARVSSAPVFNAQTIVGVFDHNVFLQHLVRSHDGLHLSAVVKGASQDPVEAEGFFARTYASLTIGQLTSLRPLEEGDYLDSAATVRRACVRFSSTDAKGKRPKRLLIRDANGNVKVLSPSAVVCFVSDAYSNPIERAAALAQHAKFDASALSPSKMVCANKSTKAWDAFALMVESGHSVIAVLEDNSSKIAGSISASDVSLMFRRKDLGLSTHSAWSYIVENRNESVEDAFPFFGIYPESTLEAAINKLRATKTHHVYVVDRSDRLRNVINFNDVCESFVGA